jgi:hypothetical protein
MGNILKKIICKKKQEAKDKYESHVYATWSCVPDNFWNSEVRRIINKKNEEERKKIVDFFKELNKMVNGK